MDTEMEETFICKLTGYEISYLINNNNAKLTNIITDYKFSKALASLFKRSYVSLKKIGITDIFMDINKDDTKCLEGTTWHICYIDENKITITCKIDDYIENWGKGSGFIY